MSHWYPIRLYAEWNLWNELWMAGVKAYWFKNAIVKNEFPGAWLSWNDFMFLYPRPTKLEGGYTGFTLSVRPSVHLSVDDMVSGA